MSILGEALLGKALIFVVAGVLGWLAKKFNVKAQDKTLETAAYAIVTGLMGKAESWKKASSDGKLDKSQAGYLIGKAKMELKERIEVSDEKAYRMIEGTLKRIKQGKI